MERNIIKKVPEDTLPKVFDKEELKHLDDNGRDCEICQQHMHSHEWAALNEAGFVVFCSNLIYDGIDLPEVVVHEYFEDDPEPEVINYGLSSVTNSERMLAQAIARAEGAIGMAGIDRVSICLRRTVVFNVTVQGSSVKLGNWEGTDEQVEQSQECREQK